MDEHLRRSGRFFALLLACPFAIAFIGAWTAGLGFVLLFFGAPLVLGTLVIGGLIFIVRGFRLARSPMTTRHRTVVATAAPLMLVATILLAWPVLFSGSFSGTFTRLLVNRGHYEAIIAKARTGQRFSRSDSAYEHDGGVDFLIDPGPPVRVAFNPAGFLDNWSGIIFDPTGDVMRADGFDRKTGKFVAPDEITKLFGGDLVGCRRLWGDYYTCSFT